MEVLSIFKWWFALASVVLAVAATVPYFTSILLGKTKPPYSTYIGWTLVGVTMVFFQYKSIIDGNSHSSMLVVVAFAAVPFCVLLLMIKAKVPWTWESRDKFSFLGLAICWIIYIGMRLQGISEIALVPMLVLALTDGFSSWPTYEDCRKGLQSSTLERISWVMTATSALCGVLSVSNYWTAEMFIPGYLALYMCAIAAASLFSKPAEDNTPLTAIAE